MKKTLSIWIACMLATLVLGAQPTTVKVQHTDGSITPFVLNEQGVIYFEEGNLLVHPQDSEPATIAMDNISKVTFETYVAVNEHTTTPVTVMPNPTTNRIRITGVGDEPQYVALYTMSGACVWNGRCAEGDAIDLSTLTSGLYLLKCGEFTAKIIKQ